MKFCFAWTAFFVVVPAACAQTPQSAAALPSGEARAIVGDVPVEADRATSVASTIITIPALTPVRLEIQSAISSKTAKMGEMFAIRLASPIIVDGQVIVPEGVTGQGEIVHAAKARAAGKAGELILAARYLDWNGTRIALRTFRYGPEVGESRVGEAIAVGAVVAAPIALFVAGGEKIVPAGTLATAKVAQAVSLSSVKPAPPHQSNNP